MRHKSKNKTRPLFTLPLEMTRLVNETRLLLVPGVNSDIIIQYANSHQYENHCWKSCSHVQGHACMQIQELKGEYSTLSRGSGRRAAEI